jgi:hypothetical protein
VRIDFKREPRGQIVTPRVEELTACQAVGGRSGFRRVFDLELASGIESELLGAQFRLESLGGSKHMHASGLAVQARIDGQHVMEQIGYGRK